MSTKERIQVKIVYAGESVCAHLSIASPTGKVRVKDRNVFYEYGKPISTRSETIPGTAYIEWQIGYDLKDEPGNLNKTTLIDKGIINNKGKRKLPYELSEILFYAYKLNLIKPEDIFAVKNSIQGFKQEELLENCLQIWRSDPKPREIANINFEFMELKYPLLVHKFGEYEVVTEILVKEKQKAVGIQPMLYVCVPMKYVHSISRSGEVVGRMAEAKEMVSWEIGSTEAKFALEVMKLFGLLSVAHQKDVLAILEKLFPEI